MKYRWTAAEWIEYQKTGKLPGDESPKKTSKLHNVPTVLDGNRYDSKHEADRAAELKLIQKAGDIAGFAEQVNFRLSPKIQYRADFVILNWDGTYTVEDAKGMQTDVYKIKKKLMAEKGLEVKEV